MICANSSIDWVVVAALSVVVVVETDEIVGMCARTALARAATAGELFCIVRRAGAICWVPFVALRVARVDTRDAVPRDAVFVAARDAFAVVARDAAARELARPARGF